MRIEKSSGVGENFGEKLTESGVLWRENIDLDQGEKTDTVPTKHLYLRDEKEREIGELCFNGVKETRFFLISGSQLA